MSKLWLSNGLGPLHVSTAYPRILARQFDQPVFLMGDAAWSLISELTTAQIDTYLLDRQSRGFNLIIVRLIDHYFSTNAPNNIYDDAPFTGANFTTPNEDYFAHADYAINKARSLGIYILLAATYLGYPTTEEGWDTEIAAASTGDMQTWGEFCGDRYKNFDNIIWLIGGDQDPTSYITKLEAFVTGLQNYDTNHLITSHSDRGTDSMDYWSGSAWLTLNGTYSTYLATTSEIQTSYNRSPIKPCLQIEAYYENEYSMTAQGERAQVYWSILGGGAGHIFGNCPIWHFGASPGASFCDAAETWTDSLSYPGSVGMTHAVSLFRSVDWYTLVPDYDNDLVTSGYGTIGTADYAGAGINSAGTLAIIYMPSNRTMTVDMSLFAGTVTAQWYDPTNGSYAPDGASPLSNSGSHDFSHAGTNNDGDADWILLLEA